MSTPDPLGRYRDRAQRVAEEFGPGHSGVENLTEAIAGLVHEFVAHDLEWAALAVEALGRQVAGHRLVDDDVSALAASFRARGRGEG